MYISLASEATLNVLTNNFVFALYDASNPTVLIESQAPTKPYAVPIQISFLYNCLVGNLYIVRLWESTGTTPTGVIRNSLTQAVNSTGYNTAITRFPDYLEADITSGLVNGTTSYVNTSWAGWDYNIERIGLGTMVPDSSADTDPNYHQVSAGGFNLMITVSPLKPVSMATFFNCFCIISIDSDCMDVFHTSN